MKKWLKAASFLLVLALAAGIFSACSGNGGNNTTTNGAGSTQAQKTVLKVATNAEFEPYEFKDENDKIVGLDIDLMDKICEMIGATADYQNMEFDSVVGSVPAGTCQVAISGLTITQKRLKNVDFSVPYYTVHQVLIVPKDDATFTATTEPGIRAALEGKKVGYCESFTGGDYVNGTEESDSAEATEGIKNVQSKPYDNISLAIQDLKNGQIEAIVMDDVVAKRAVSNAQNKDVLKVVDVPLTNEDYGIVIKKGDTEMKTKIDDALNTLKTNGFLDDLIDEWILSE